MINHRFKANRPKVIGDTNITPYWKVIENIINESDIVLEILDARMPELSRSREIEEIVNRRGRKLILVLNKADLVPKKYLKKYKKSLKKETNCFYISTKEKSGIDKLRSYLIGIGKKHERLNIGVLGYPNTGKSSVINALVKRHKAKVTSRAGTTHGQQWINFKDNIRIIDSPGVIPLKQNDELRYALIGSKNPEKIKNIDMVTYKIINLFHNKEKLAEFYKIKINSNDPQNIIEEIGRKRKFIKKGNLVDENKTSIQLIRDWQMGKLRL